MRFIPTRVHGLIDYLVGGTLIAAPRLLGFADGSARQRVPVAMGAFVIGYSAITNYERGLVKAIPMKTHLSLDVLTGTILASSRWVFGFAHRTWWPHLVVGLASIVVPQFTQTRPSYENKEPEALLLESINPSR